MSREVPFAYDARYGGYHCQGCKRRLQSGETTLCGRTQTGDWLVVAASCGGGLLEEVWKSHRH